MLSRVHYANCAITWVTGQPGPDAPCWMLRQSVRNPALHLGDLGAPLPEPRGLNDFGVITGNVINVFVICI